MREGMKPYLNPNPYREKKKKKSVKSLGGGQQSLPSTVAMRQVKEERLYSWGRVGKQMKDIKNENKNAGNKKTEMKSIFYGLIKRLVKYK